MLSAAGLLSEEDLFHLIQGEACRRHQDEFLRLSARGINRGG